MPLKTTSTDFRTNLAKWMNRVDDDADYLVIDRRGNRPLALIAADELEQMRETIYLLRSPENQKRIAQGIQEGKTGRVKSQTAAEIRAEFGLDR